MKLTFGLIFAVLTAAIGSGFQFGYNIPVLNNPQEIIKPWVRENANSPSDRTLDAMWGNIVGLFSLGAAVGGGFTKVICDNLGRRGGLMMNCFLTFIPAVIFGLTKIVNSVVLLFVGRFIIGLNAGLNAGMAPVYICEISPTKIRGAMGSLFQLCITISILIAQLLGFEKALGTEKLWPFLLSLIGVVGLLQLICLIFCPESPRFILEKKNDEAKAMKGCETLGGEEFQEQFNELKREVEEQKKLPQVTFTEMFTQKKLRRALILICALMSAQQLSGINAIMFYSTEIGKMAQFSERTSQLITIGIGLENVLASVGAVYLVESFGRKPLLLVAFGCMFFCMLVLTGCLYYAETSLGVAIMAVVAVYLYVLFFAVGAGPVPWLLGPELFSTSARALGCSFGVVFNWGWAYVISISFPLLQPVMGPLVFIIYMVCNVLAFIFVWIFCPETRNKTIDEITAFFE